MSSSHFLLFPSRVSQRGARTVGEVVIEMKQNFFSSKAGERREAAVAEEVRVGSARH